MRARTIRIGQAAVAVVALELLNIFSADVASAFAMPPGGLGAEVIRMTAEALVWLAGALLIVRLLDLFVWNGIILRQTGAPATRLLTDLVNGLVFVSAIVGVIAFVLDKPITGLIATSGVAVAVVGFALKSMISDLFSGIAITLERPFRVGDWVEIPGGVAGKVLHMSWRATGLMQKNGIYVTVPNGRLSEMVLKIHDHPDPAQRDQIDILFGYEIAGEQAERLLLSAAAAVPEVAAQPRKPDVRIVEFGENGVKWRLRYWIPHYDARSRMRYAVQRNILSNLHFSGIERPINEIKATILPPQPPADETHGIAAFLSRVSLFRALDAAEIAELAQRIDMRLALPGTALVSHGETGASLFVVKEGLFEVLVPDGGGFKSVAHLKAGSFFGEMSLLTGAPRGATVRAVVESIAIEIDKAALQPIFARRDALVETMSRVLAERQLHNDKALAAAASAADRGAVSQTLAQQLLGRMRSFFGLGQPA